MAKAGGSIGTRRDLEVRVGDTLRPQLLVIQLESGQTLDPDGASVVARIFRRENDVTPLSSPVFTVQALPPLATGEAQYLLRLEKEDVEALAAAPRDVGPAAHLRTSDAGRRMFFWSASFRDAGGTHFPLYYGRLTIYLGAAPAGGA